MIKRDINLVAAAFSLTALSYGLARFSYGLLLPHISEALSLTATSAGWIGSGAFVAYCVGIVLAFGFDLQLGSRRMAALAGLAATGGLALMSIAWSTWSLGMAIALAGLSTGLTSPPLAMAVAQTIASPARPRANGAINAGTAAGIVVSGVAVMTVSLTWRELYALFAGIGLLITVWLWVALPAGIDRHASARLSIEDLKRNGVAHLCGSAWLAGAATTAIWTFGATIMRDTMALSDTRIALAWIILGIAGSAGVLTGALTDRWGIARVHRAAIGAMCLSLAGFAAASLFPTAAFADMALFGAAYIVTTGAFLLWGIRIFPDRPSFGLGLPFLTLALGQASGAPLFGVLSDSFGNVAALLCFMLIMACAAIWTADRDIEDPRETDMPAMAIRTAR